MELVFWVSVGLIVYTYAGYPLLLALLQLVCHRPVTKRTYLPPVTIIIPFYNEERRVRDKLQNTLDLDYPGDLLQIIVASDCSTDGTDDLLRTYTKSHGVEMVRLEERQGKHYAQGLALQSARNDIIVFSDASISLPRNSLQKMMGNFSDPGIGCVTSQDAVLDDPDGNNREGLYIRYDMWLRRLESDCGSTTGLSGAFYATRRELTEDWAPDMSNDFYIPLRAVRRGLRAIIDPNVTCSYKLVRSFREEFKRKVRTIVHGLQVFFHHGGLLNPFRFGLYAWKLASHKLCRWLVPLFMAIAYASNLYLIPHDPLYLWLFILQTAFYGIAALGFLFPGWHRLNVVRIVYFFAVANLAIAVGWIKFLTGERYTSWEPSKR